ncbi:MAG: FHA domain-containing protein [Solirubrobacteraceae bacterium]|jgi:pSer/pThr/pTyr-binding forkhead associated (FHA) protein
MGHGGIGGASSAAGDEAAPAARSGRDVQERLIAGRSGNPFLVYQDGGGAQQVVVLDEEARALTIGRNDEADVAIVWDAEVSRLHAQLECAAGEWVVVDDGLSSNGTFVNGQRIAARRRLVDGDLIRVGGTVVLFRGPARGPSPTVRAGSAVTADQLSETQRKVLVALCRPYHASAHLATPASNQQIATELFLSLDAVKANLRAMYQLFGVAKLPQNQKRAQLAERAIAWGLVRSEF